MSKGYHKINNAFHHKFKLIVYSWILWREIWMLDFWWRLM